MIPRLFTRFKSSFTRRSAVALPLPLPLHPARPLPLTVPDLPSVIAACPVAVAAFALLRPLDWSAFPERPTDRAFAGPRPAPRAPFVAAFLLKLDQQHPSMGHLRRFLVQHPALVWLLGFPLVADPAAPLGFDVAASVPSRRQFSRVLRTLSAEALTWLLANSVHQIRDALPADPAAPFADQVAGDTKHIVAWVKENNPNRHAPDRADKTVQPPGDPDCKLGVKSRSNRLRPAAAPPPTPTTEPRPASQEQAQTEAYWGYASGIVVTRTAAGTIVLAERTRPFNEGDMTYFAPLMAQTEACLGYRPRIGAWDAAFDSQETYAYFHAAGGFAAVPLNARGQDARTFDAAGNPCCAAGLGMPRQFAYQHRSDGPPHERGKHRCPLLFPQATGDPCPIDDPHFATGGCTTTVATSVGARIRWQLDREGDPYRTAYRQRTMVEQINSQALALGIERPKLRSLAGIAHQTTLMYVLINLRAYHRLQDQALPLHA